MHWQIQGPRVFILGLIFMLIEGARHPSASSVHF